MNNYKVCGVYSPEPCAEVYCVRLNFIYRNRSMVIAGGGSQMNVVIFARLLSQALEPTETLKQANGTMAIYLRIFISLTG